MHVRWDTGVAATPHGQLVFFAEFLAATGVFERWVSTCPLSYRSGNAPDKPDVLCTLMLGLQAPAGGTLPEAVRVLAREAAECSRPTGMRERLAGAGLEPSSV